MRRCLAVILGLMGWGGVLTAAVDRPNFLVLFADDQRADTIGAWGNPWISTPHLDRLVASGYSFRGNYCFGGNSGAVCIPSRAMLMSGRTWLDVSHNLAGVPLLPEVLRDHGYFTFATGKWHNERPSFRRAFERGRSVFFGGMDDHTAVSITDLAGTNFTAARPALRFSSEEFADTAIEFLAGCTNGRPFFGYVAFMAPHDPRNPPVAWREMYYRARPPLPDNFLPVHPFNTGWNLNLRDENLAPYPRTPDVIRDQLSEYYGLITHLDGQIGRILAALARSPHATNTYVIFAADHGLALGSHGLLGKQNVYEHSMRCPLIIAGPGIPAGRQTAAFTYLFDLFPTVTRLAGVPSPPGLAGADLRPLWDGSRSRVRDSVFLPYMNAMRAVRDERWKLILYPPIQHRQLFDLAADPGEKFDLSGDPARAGEIERLTALMAEWRKKVGDTAPLEVAAPRSKVLDPTGYRRLPDGAQPWWSIGKYFTDP